jgi:hypothetical protein
MIYITGDGCQVTPVRPFGSPGQPAMTLSIEQRSWNIGSTGTAHEVDQYENHREGKAMADMFGIAMTNPKGARPKADVTGRGPREGGAEVKQDPLADDLGGEDAVHNPTCVRNNQYSYKGEAEDDQRPSDGPGTLPSSRVTQTDKEVPSPWYGLNTNEYEHIFRGVEAVRRVKAQSPNREGEGQQPWRRYESQSNLEHKPQTTIFVPDSPIPTQVGNYESQVLASQTPSLRDLPVSEEESTRYTRNEKGKSGSSIQGGRWWWERKPTSSLKPEGNPPMVLAQNGVRGRGYSEANLRTVDAEGEPEEKGNQATTLPHVRAKVPRPLLLLESERTRCPPVIRNDPKMRSTVTVESLSKDREDSQTTLGSKLPVPVSNGSTWSWFRNPRSATSRIDIEGPSQSALPEEELSQNIRRESRRAESPEVDPETPRELGNLTRWGIWRSSTKVDQRGQRVSNEESVTERELR